MSDLISRKAAISAIESHIRTAEEPYQLTEKDKVLNYAFDVAISCLLNLPSAQPEIIQCKDCKHIQEWRSEESVKKFGQIYECARNVLNCPKPEDFCSHAERRTDE